MSTPTSRKTYTRRNTRTRLIDLLKEAIELVEKGCPPGHMTRGILSLPLPSTSMPVMPAMPNMTTAMPATSAPAPKTKAMTKKLAKAPLSAIPEENVTQTISQPAFVPVKPKGAPRPGVLKYNEFVKDWISKHPEYQAKEKYQAALKEIKRSGNWDRVSGTRKKGKAPVSNAAPVSNVAPLINATPARVSPALPLRNNANPSNTINVNTRPTTANSTPATLATAESSTYETTANSTPATPATLATLTNAAPYTNEGLNDNVGMRKISMNGRSLYLSSDNGLFQREGNAPGDFIGRLVDGKIVEEDAPELPEYS